MRELRFWQVDTFTNQPFKGNPAAVFILEENIEASLMQNIAAEMNLSETAFILLRKGNRPLLRWFTPIYEIDLCGHATLASAEIYFSQIDSRSNEITFDTKYAGPLKVIKNQRSLTMNFPSRPGEKIKLDSIPEFVIENLCKKKPIDARKSRDLMLVYEDEKSILEMKPNFNGLLDYKDEIIVTAKSKSHEYDFISRFFAAADAICEDPVTGSAHCTLAPYWSEKLGKNNMVAYQASKRGGTLYLELQKQRLNITGEAVTVIDGILRI